MLTLSYLAAFIVTVHSLIIPIKQQGEGQLVKLQFIDTDLGRSRFRRASDSDFEMPEQLEFTVTIDGVDVELLLEISDISTRPPLYESVNGQPKLYTLDDTSLQQSALYQGVSNGASYMVTCTGPSLEQCSFQGSFYHGQSRFTMTPGASFRSAGLHEVQEVGTDERKFGDDVQLPPEFVQKENLKDRTRRSFQDGSQSRRKRATTDTNIVEFVAVTDESVYQTFFDTTGSESEALAAIQAYYALQINEIDLHFWSVSQVDPSLTIRVVPVGVVFAKTADDAPWSRDTTIVLNDITYLQGSQALSSFNAWRNIKRCKLPIHDHAMAFTMKDLEYVNGNTATRGLAGLAYVSQVCRSYDTSITEDDFHRTANTAAHELGHSLGARHDVTTDCPRSARNIMTPTLYLTTNLETAEAQYIFSSCSVSSFNDHIASLSDNCLKDHSFESSILDQPLTLPGEIFSIDQQCKMKKGEEYSSCVQQVPESGCYRGIRCDTSCGAGSYSGYYPMAGTPCGNTGNKWCYRGLCRDKPTTTTSSTTTTTTATVPVNPCEKTCCVQRRGTAICCSGNDCCKPFFRRKLNCCEECLAFEGRK